MPSFGKHIVSANQNSVFNQAHHLIDRCHYHTQTCIESANPVELDIIIRV